MKFAPSMGLRGAADRLAPWPVRSPGGPYFGGAGQTPIAQSRATRTFSDLQVVRGCLNEFVATLVYSRNASSVILAVNIFRLFAASSLLVAMEGPLSRFINHLQPAGTTTAWLKVTNSSIVDIHQLA